MQCDSVRAIRQLEEELGVELYYGALSSQGEIEEPRRLPMRPWQILTVQLRLGTSATTG